MKKVIIVLFFVTAIYMFTNKNEKDIIIPNNAIRFRVIANSNSVEDQAEKMVIKEKLEKEVYDLINGASSSSEVKNILENNMDEIDKIVSSYQVPYKISYGLNYFPSKSYKGVVYGAGNYESLVITLGNGLGNNFWCVLFPPLCMLEANEEDLSDVDYQFYVKKILDKF